jgi:hypothetical protein
LRERREGVEFEPAGASPDAEGPDAPRDFPRLAGLEGGGRRRPSGRRIALAAAAASGVLLALAALYHLAAHAVGWLHRQPAYELAFSEIVLEPPPPPYIRLDAEALLERVRRAAGRPERIPMLDTDLGELAAEFGKHTPWVESVRGVSRSYPNRLVVRLSYREPVAAVRLRGGATIYLDRDAYVLPNDELVPEEAGPLVLVEGLPGPLQTRPGLRVAPPETEAERLAVRATGLATFFRDHETERADAHAPRIVALYLAHQGQYPMAGLDLDGDPGPDAWAYFGPPAGYRGADPLSTADRWKQFLEWFERPDRPRLDYPMYLEFTPHGPRAERGRASRSGNPAESPDPSG